MAMDPAVSRCSRLVVPAMNDVQMVIQCLWCLEAWDIDRDPVMCTCDDDSDWVLNVIEDES